MSESLITKISPKSITGKIVKPENEKPVWLYKVFGVANGTKEGESNYGHWIAFTGTFKAIRNDGESFRSGQCFLPATATNLVLPSLKNEGTNAVEFAFNVGVKKADNQIGYEYIVEPILNVSDNDPIMLLEQKIEAQTVAKLENKSTKKTAA